MAIIESLADTICNGSLKPTRKQKCLVECNCFA